MIHNHETEEGEGLSCPELRLLGGALMGECIYRERIETYAKGNSPNSLFNRSIIMRENSPERMNDSEPNERLTADEETLFKAVRALRQIGMNDRLIKDALNAMQNAGILFRERA